ncbi:MAG: glucose 1-dehydrogenase [Planctomycetes bacterium]|nr:glucose 1-dehydrogenase [Planctomycetota bacterium]
MNPRQLEGKHALITGAGSGIGAATARAFAAQGAAVALLDLDFAAVETVARSITALGAKAVAFACDVGDAASVAAAVDAAIEWSGRLHILVNNAGIAHVGTALDTTEADLDRVYRVNVKGVQHCTQRVLPHLIAHGGGCILNMCSIAALIGIEARLAYSMSKGAVLAMTRSVAVDFMAHGVRCNCICPARVHTPFVDGFIKATYPGREAEMFAKLSAYQPMGRMGTPEEVAAMAVYLASDAAGFITGQAFPIDGGVLVR